MSGIVGSKLNIRGSGLVGSLGTDGQHLLSAGAGKTNVFETVAAGVSLTLTSEVATTSGTSVDLSTSIPAGTKMITVMFDKVSTNSTGYLEIQIGDAGGFETSGYVGGMGGTIAAEAAGSVLSIGFTAVNILAATATYSGLSILRLQDSSTFTWVCSSMIGASAGSVIDVSGGSKSLSAELTQIRLLSNDTLDAGAISLQYS